MVEQWYQDHGDAQRTGCVDVEPTQPWRYLWAWNGPDASAGPTGHKLNLPPEGRPVAGGGRLYVPLGSQGLVALDLATGAELWHWQLGTVMASPAYHAATDSVLVGLAEGFLVRLAASTGADDTALHYATSGATVTRGSSGTQAQPGSPILKAPLIVGNNAYCVCEDGSLHKVAINSGSTAPSVVWRYAGGASDGQRAETPAAYSASAGKLIYCTADGFVHAVTDSSGAASWRVKPYSGTAGWPNSYERTWPVVADVHGIVFVRCGRYHDAQIQEPGGGYSGTGTAETDGNAIRTWLQANTGVQNLFPLNLTDGSTAFVPAVGPNTTEWILGGAAYGVTTQMPIIKNRSGQEVAYCSWRSRATGVSVDYRWDSLWGEMAQADNDPISGLSKGNLRFIDLPAGYPYITDEISVATMAGETILSAHWGALDIWSIADRSGTKGATWATRITVTNRPPIVTQAQAITSDFDPAGHVSAGGLSLYADTRNWAPQGGAAYYAYYGCDDPGVQVESVLNTNHQSIGYRPRIGFVTGQYVVFVTSGGGILVFRHSGSGTGFSTPSAPTGLAFSVASTFEPGKLSGVVHLKATPIDAMFAPATSGTATIVAKKVSDNTTVSISLYAPSVTQADLDGGSPPAPLSGNQLALSTLRPSVAFKLVCAATERIYLTTTNTLGLANVT